MSSNEILVQRFAAAKCGDMEATNFIVSYFISRVEEQLENLNISGEKRADKIPICHRIILQNIRVYFNYRDFFEQTMDDLKNFIYGNQIRVLTNSREIIESQKSLVVTKEEIDSLDIPIIAREIARLYFVEKMDVERIESLTKVKEAMIYVHLKRVLKALTAKKMSNYTQNEETFVYN